MPKSARHRTCLDVFSSPPGHPVCTSTTTRPTRRAAPAGDGALRRARAKVDAWQDVFVDLPGRPEGAPRGSRSYSIKAQAACMGDEVRTSATCSAATIRSSDTIEAREFAGAVTMHEQAVLDDLADYNRYGYVSTAPPRWLDRRACARPTSRPPPTSTPPSALRALAAPGTNRLAAEAAGPSYPDKRAVAALRLARALAIDYYPRRPRPSGPPAFLRLRELMSIWKTRDVVVFDHDRCHDPLTDWHLPRAGCSARARTARRSRPGNQARPRQPGEACCTTCRALIGLSRAGSTPRAMCASSGHARRRRDRRGGARRQPHVARAADRPELRQIRRPAVSRPRSTSGPDPGDRGGA